MATRHRDRSILRRCSHESWSVILSATKTAEAIEQFKAALRLDANHVDAHFNYGELLAGLGKIDEAKYQYQEALRVAPGYQAAQTALRNLGESKAGIL